MPDRAIEIKVNTDVASARDGIAALKQTIEEAAQAAAAMNDTLAATGSALDTGSAGIAYAHLADSARQASDALNELMGKASELETALAELDGSMPDFSEGVAALESLQSSMEIVVEIQQKVAAAAEEIDPNLPWEEFGGKMQSVVEVYTEVEATIIRTAEAVVASEESQLAAAEKKAEAVIAAYQKENAQVTQSLGELKAQLEEYKRKMEEAAAAGDKIGQAEAIKGIEEMTGKITALGKAQEQSAGRAFGMISGFQNLFAMFVTGQVSARGLIVSIKSIGTAIKTGLGPVGWGILLLEGLSAAVNVFWNHLTGKSKAAADEAEAARKKAEEEAKKMKELQIKIEDESNAKIIRQTYDYIHRRAVETTLETKAQTREIKHQLDLKMGKIDQEVMDINSEYDRLSDKIIANGKKNGSSDIDIADALRRNQDARELAVERKNKERLTGAIESNETAITKLGQGLVDFENELDGWEKSSIKTTQDVDYFLDMLKNAYAKETKDNKLLPSVNELMNKINEIKLGKNKPDGMNQGQYWWSATSDLVESYEDVFQMLADKHRTDTKGMYKILKRNPELFMGALKVYIKDADENKEEIDRLESEFRPFLGKSQRDANGHYSEKSIKEAGSAKLKTIEALRTQIKNDKEEIDRLVKENELLTQSAEKSDKSIINKKDGIQKRDKRIAEERAREIRDREAEAEEKKNIETANIDSLNDMLKQAIEAQKKAKSNNNPQEHAKQTALIETLKSAIKDKEEVKSEVKSEIMSVVNDVIAKSKRNGGKMSKQDAAFVKFAEKLISYFDDGQVDLSELQEFSAYLPLLAKYQASNKENIAGIMNIVLKNSEKSADVFGGVSKQYKDLHDYVKDGFAKIEKRIKINQN